jgi:hypothetical protein
MKQKKISLAEWAKSVGVSFPCARNWGIDGRISARHIRKGVWEIEAGAPRPEKLDPWHKARTERIEREKLSL